MAASIRAFFKAKPLVANCITYGSLYTGAEFLQQTLLRLDYLFTSLSCERASMVRGHSTTMWAELCHFFVPLLLCQAAWNALSGQKQTIF